MVLPSGWLWIEVLWSRSNSTQRQYHMWDSVKGCWYVAINSLRNSHKSERNQWESELYNRTVVYRSFRECFYLKGEPLPEYFKGRLPSAWNQDWPATINFSNRRFWWLDCFQLLPKQQASCWNINKRENQKTLETHHSEPPHKAKRNSWI